MACRSYAQRRRLLAASYAKSGIEGAANAKPSVGHHLVSKPA